MIKKQYLPSVDILTSDPAFNPKVLISLQLRIILDEYLKESKAKNSEGSWRILNGLLFNATNLDEDTESSLNLSIKSKDIFETDRDGMPDPRRSIEIELQWLVSAYSPKILIEIQNMLNVNIISFKNIMNNSIYQTALEACGIELPFINQGK